MNEYCLYTVLLTIIAWLTIPGLVVLLLNRWEHREYDKKQKAILTALNSRPGAPEMASLDYFGGKWPSKLESAAFLAGFRAAQIKNFPEDLNTVPLTKSDFLDLMVKDRIRLSRKHLIAVDPVDNFCYTIIKVWELPTNSDTEFKAQYLMLDAELAIWVRGTSPDRFWLSVGESMNNPNLLELRLSKRNMLAAEMAAIQAKWHKKV